MTAVLRRNQTIRVAIILVTVIAVVLTVCSLQTWRPGVMLARRWQHQLQSVPDAEAITHMQRIAGLGDDSLAILVDSLHSPRPSIVGAAQTVLVEQVDDWQLMSSRESAPKIAALARHLSENIWKTGPQQRRMAAHLALRFLAWPVAQTTVDRTGLITDCETILRTAGTGTAPQFGRRPKAGQAEVAANLQSFDAPTEKEWGVQERVSRSLDDAPNVSGENPPLSAPNSQPPAPLLLPFFGPASAQPAKLSGQRSRNRTPPDSPFPDVLSEPFARWIPRTTPPVQRAQRPESEGKLLSWNVPEQAASAVTRISDIALMRRLNDEDRASAEQAKRELRKRGFLTIHIELARRLTHPDPGHRVAMAESLPSLQVDARPWLFWLLDDEHPEVRVAAISVLATTADQAVDRRLRQMELDETDPSVLRHLRHVLRHMQ